MIKDLWQPRVDFPLTIYLDSNKVLQGIGRCNYSEKPRGSYRTVRIVVSHSQFLKLLRAQLYPWARRAAAPPIVD